MPNARYGGVIEKNESRLGNGSFLTYFLVKQGGGDRFVFGGFPQIIPYNNSVKLILHLLLGSTLLSKNVGVGRLFGKN